MKTWDFEVKSKISIAIKTSIRTEDLDHDWSKIFIFRLLVYGETHHAILLVMMKRYFTWFPRIIKYRHATLYLKGKNVAGRVGIKNRRYLLISSGSILVQISCTQTSISVFSTTKINGGVSNQAPANGVNVWGIDCYCCITTQHLHPTYTGS